MGRVNLALLTIAIFCVTFWFTDHTTNHHPAAPRIVPEEVAARRAARSQRPRVFVLILDSLRYETATNPEIMPHLMALRAEGVYARFDAGFNSSSAAALRDAFTGRENAAVLAVVSTFLKTDAGVESIFHQLSLAGITSAVYGQDYFTQFGAGITYQSVIGFRALREVDEANVLKGADALRRGEFDFVVGHISYTDYAAHDFGIYKTGYREAFHRADDFILRVRAALPPDTTFVVMGDHGHDEQGKHGFGMEVPTFAVYAGPPFRRGRDLGFTNLPSHRFLMSYAAGIPLNTEGYTGRFLPEALNGGYDEVQWLVARVQAARAWALQRTWLVWIQISLLGALCFNLYCRGRSPLNFDGGRALLPWIGAVPLVLTSPWAPWLGLAAMAGLVLVLGRGAPGKKVLAWVAAPALAGLAFQGWGRVLIVIKPLLQHLPAWSFTLGWLAVAFLGAAVANRARRPLVMAIVMGVPLLLFHPTGERHGFPGTLAPLLLCWLFFHAVSRWREGVLTGRAAVTMGLAGAGVFLLAQPFWQTEAADGNFLGWHSLVPGLDLKNVPYIVGLAFLAKAVIFFPRWPGWPGVVLGAGLVLLLVLAEGGVWRPDSYGQIALMLACLAGWWGLRRIRPEEARLLQLTFWFLLYYYSIALNPRTFLETGCLLGALTLCARVAARDPQRENLRADYLGLAVLGLLITGWACMRWSSSELEWHTAYEWFSAPTVERRAVFFVPWIALKCLLPWVLVLSCLRQELGAHLRLPANALLVIFGVKIMSMLMINTGLGGADTLNRSYLEAACVSGVLAVLALGVILLPDVWPLRPEPDGPARAP